MNKQSSTWDATKEFSRLNVVSSNERKPPRIVLYGGAKVGKTTFAASAEKPIFICTEEGLGDLEVPHFPLVTEFSEIVDHIDALVVEDHDYKTVVIDSLDWTESIVWNQVTADHGKKNIEEIGYGKGYILAVNYWMEILNGLTYLRNKKGMTCILIAHAIIKPFNNPMTEAFDRYSLKLHEKARAKVSEWADCLLFAAHKVVTKEGKNEKHRGIGRGERILYTEERPGFEAGNRYSLPSEMPFAYEIFHDAIKGQ